MHDPFKEHLDNLKFVKDAERATTLEEKVEFCKKFLAEHNKTPQTVPQTIQSGSGPYTWLNQNLDVLKDYNDYSLSKMTATDMTYSLSSVVEHFCVSCDIDESRFHTSSQKSDVIAEEIKILVEQLVSGLIKTGYVDISTERAAITNSTRVVCKMKVVKP